MGFWEEGHIWRNNSFSRHLVYYGRFIDDIIIIWDGPPDMVPTFVEYCNTNPFNVRFTYLLNPKNLVFLDLVLSWDEDGNITSKTHFKGTTGNSYLHYRSCHLQSWKQNMPYSQFNRLCKNCTNTSDYLKQANILQNFFWDKGYTAEHIQEASGV